MFIKKNRFCEELSEKRLEERAALQCYLDDAVKQQGPAAASNRRLLLGFPSSTKGQPHFGPELFRTKKSDPVVLHIGRRD